MLAPLRRIGGRIGGAFPSWAKPSKITALTGVATGLVELVFTPTVSDGQNYTWTQFLQKGFADFKVSQNPIDILGWDGQNDVFSQLAAQMKQNALPAAGTMAGFGILAAIERYFGM